MPRKSTKSEKAESAAVEKAAQAEAEDRQQAGPRRFTPRSFRSRRKRRKAEKKLARTRTAGSFTIFGRAVKVLRDHWEVFGGLFVLFAVINTILTAGSLLRIDLEATRANLQVVDSLNELGTGLALYGTLISVGTGTAGGSAGAYQMILMVVISLAMVWALRQFLAGNAIRIRDALYNSSYPLVPVLIILLVVFLQLLPALAGLYLSFNLIGLGIIIVAWQQALIVFIGLLLTLWTVYMVTASIFALYIATLPGMTPLKALRAARDIVQYRRAMVFRRLLFLPAATFVVGAIIVVPLGLLLPTAATYVFFILGMAVLPLVHAYLYTLYRELIS